MMQMNKYVISSMNKNFLTKRYSTIKERKMTKSKNYLMNTNKWGVSRYITQGRKSISKNGWKEEILQPRDWFVSYKLYFYFNLLM